MPPYNLTHSVILFLPKDKVTSVLGHLDTRSTVHPAPRTDHEITMLPLSLESPNPNWPPHPAGEKGCGNAQPQAGVLPGSDTFSGAVLGQAGEARSGRAGSRWVAQEQAGKQHQGPSHVTAAGSIKNAH